MERLVMNICCKRLCQIKRRYILGKVDSSHSIERNLIDPLQCFDLYLYTFLWKKSTYDFPGPINIRKKDKRFQISILIT